MSAGRMVRIERTGQGVHDWKLSMDDGRELPPIRAFEIAVTANELPSLTLDVADVHFNGVLPAKWRVDFDTLAAMVADAGLEMNALGELGARETVIREREETISDLGHRCGGLDSALAEARRLLEKAESDADFLRMSRDSLRERMKEFRETNISLRREIEAEKRRAEEAEARNARAEQTAIDLREKLAAERDRADRGWAKANQLRRDQEGLRAGFDEAREELLQALAEARTAAEREATLRKQAKPLDLADKMLDALRADMTKRHLDEKRALQEEINALKAEIGAFRHLRVDASDAMRRSERYAEENHLLKRRMAISGVGAAALVDDIRDRLAATTLHEGEPVLHTYDRVATEALAAFTDAPEPARKPARRTMIVAPDHTTAEALRKTIGADTDDLFVRSIQTTYGCRADVVIVLPPTKAQEASARAMFDYLSALEAIHTRIAAGGKVVRL